MRIGFITGEYPPMEGGVGAFTHELATALADLGHEVHILTHHQAERTGKARIQVAAEVRNWNWAALMQAQRWARQNRLEVVNLQYEAAAFGKVAPLVHILPARLSDFATVITFHDLLVPYLFPKAGSLRYQALLNLARTAKGVIVTNVQDEQQLAQERGIAPMRRIPIGSNIAPTPPPDFDRAAVRAALEIPEDGVLIGYFGFLNASKGAACLLRGVAQALQQGVNAYLVLIGGRTGTSDPSNVHYAESVDALIGQLQLSQRVRRTGFIESAAVSAHLLACDMLALPYTDGVSFRRGSFMAGLAHGCPIITSTPALPLPELHHGDHVYLVPPEQPEALGEAIRTLAEAPQLRTRLSYFARQLAEQFTWTRIAQRTADFFLEVITESAEP
ncbi:MAG: glycosyl transferase family 1 [Candidatus Thermofonsia Clade 1 bacterium]|jgi:glycosyltransferase involved in cell wall biosynthesis|uniref:Glycosyl transferase family 1 n=1 Tax=Candidatus Thermofonsia Clade 1 bacterium TaxID=2364210 RepID=A0A2M8PDZ1_9CHLR|nr:MAG: glycosyl transferase family 1 [Candidatus Thermofonsia Clade 1 bacterium]